MDEKKQAKAITKKVGISPYRVRLIVNLIRGKQVSEAEAILKNSPQLSAVEVLKTLNSAVSNAINNLKLQKETLYVKEARVDQGKTLKRYKFDSRGRIGHKNHQSSHIVIVVESR